MGKIGKMSFDGGNLLGNRQTDRKFVFMKKMWPQGIVCPCLGADSSSLTNEKDHHYFLNSADVCW